MGFRLLGTSPSARPLENLIHFTKFQVPVIYYVDLYNNKKTQIFCVVITEITEIHILLEKLPPRRQH